MIFAMVGMHTSGFERLIEALDRYAERHSDCEVLMQIGSSRYLPKSARYFTFNADLHDELAKADVVVSHGSVAFLEALQLGKKLVVVPRLARFGEVVDDHQLHFSRKYALKYAFPVVDDMAQLEETLDRVRSGPPPAPYRPEKQSALHGEIRAYLAGLEKKA